MTTMQQQLDGSPETFDSRDPATDDVVGTHTVHTSEDVADAVERARRAAGWWSELGYQQRAERLRLWKGIVTRRMAQLCEIVHAETGKPHSDAQLEITHAIEHLAC